MLAISILVLYAKGVKTLEVGSLSPSAWGLWRELGLPEERIDIAELFKDQPKGAELRGGIERFVG